MMPPWKTLLGVGPLPVEADQHALELRRVGVEQRQQRPARPGLGDQRVLVLRQRHAGRARQAGQAAERPVEVTLLLGEGARGDGGVAQQPDQVGGGHVVRVGHLRQQLEVGAQRRQLDIHPVEVVVQRLEGVAELLALALQGVRERVQRGVEVGGAHRAQQREQVGEDALQLDVGRDPVRRDDRAVAQRATGRGPGLGRDQLEVVLAEERRRQDLHRDVAGDRPGGIRLERQRDLGPLAVALDALDVAHQRAVEPDVAEPGQLEPGAIGHDRDIGARRELLLVHRDAQPDQQADRQRGTRCRRTTVGGVRAECRGRGSRASATP